MEEPKAGKVYIFIRSKNGRVEHTEFTRYADGSAGFVADRMDHVYENHTDAWKDALGELERLGFVEMSEAKIKGIIPDSWEPTAESSALHACRGSIDIFDN